LKISNSDWAILSDIVCLLVFRIPLAEKVGNIVPPTRDGVQRVPSGSQKVNTQVMELDAADGLDDDMVDNPPLIPASLSIPLISCIEVMCLAHMNCHILNSA
jgi:hypothetical protein